MKIKTKLTLGVGLLFLLIIILTAVGVKYINALGDDTENILAANYNTLDYSRQMLIAMDEGINHENSIRKFEINLAKQQRNISEIGEKELTENLSEDFDALKASPGDTAIYARIRKDLTDIMLLNMQAIQRKSAVAERTAGNATLWIAITGTLCFIIAFTLLVNLPGNIANPIRELTGSIRQIAAKDYSQRVHFESHNEFGELARSFNTMAEKLEEYNNSNLARLMMEKKRIDTLVNNMHDPVIGLDEQRKVIFVNDRALKIIGLAQQDLVGRFMQDIAVTNDLVRMLLQELLLSQHNQEHKDSGPLKIYADGKESYFDKEILNITIVPTGENTRRFIGYVMILRNVTPYKELDFAKTNFIANVSHELKTPIASIKMSLQLLENKQVGVVNEEQKNLLESIKGDADRLLKITGELLNMTQVESGNVQLSIEPADPLEILDYAMNANKVQAEQKHIRFDMSAAKKGNYVLADKEKTAWVLTNLVSNAIRYSYDDSIIYLSVTGDAHTVSLSVRDTGQGIAPQYKDKIFDRYFRVPGSAKEGTGLGLAISKEFIEAQGGHIMMESDFGAGSTFTVVLNRAV